MKKTFIFLLVIGMITFLSCGQSSKEKAEKAKQDSIAKIDSITKELANKVNSFKRMDIKTAIDSGTIKLILEGIENGEKLNIKAENKTTAPLIVIIPTGNTEIKVDNSRNVSTEQEIQIDLTKTNTGEAKVKQSGKNRIFAGSVTMERKAKGMSYNYQNTQIGVKQ